MSSLMDSSQDFRVCEEGYWWRRGITALAKASLPKTLEAYISIKLRDAKENNRANPERRLQKETVKNANLLSCGTKDNTH